MQAQPPCPSAISLNLGLSRQMSGQASIPSHWEKIAKRKRGRIESSNKFALVLQKLFAPAAPHT
jgi:hypothetical protein